LSQSWWLLDAPLEAGHDRHPIQLRSAIQAFRPCLPAGIYDRLSTRAAFSSTKMQRNANMLTRRTVLAASAIAAIGAAPLRAQAQTLRKTVHIVVGFPPGGATDLIARILADRLRGRYAAAVIIENKPGGAARVAVDYVKNAEPDGSEFLF